MNKKVLLAVLAVLALLIVPMSPAMAVTKAPCTFTITGITPVPGSAKIWTEGNVQHVMGQQVRGTFTSDALGIGTFEATFDRRVNLLTGEGTYTAWPTITITAGGELGLGTGSISGIGEAKVTYIPPAPPVPALYPLQGSAVYTRGTDGFAGAMIRVDFWTIATGTAGAGTIAY